MAGKNEIAEFMRVISSHIDKRARNVHAPHKTDFGDVIGKDSDGVWKILIRGNGIELRATAFYWSQYYLPGTGWLYVVPVASLTKNDRLSLVCTEGEYTVVGKAVLG
jgi:hypothetical protein